MNNELLLRARNGLIAAGLGIALVLFCMVWPMTVPAGAMLQNVLSAMAAGFTAVALVLVYRSIRIINFVQLGLGAISALLFYEFYTREIMPFGIALVVGLAAGVLVSLLVGIILSTLFYRHPRLVLMIVTIFVAQLVAATIIPPLVAAIQDENELPRAPEQILGPWPDKFIEVGGLPFRFIHFLMFGLLVVTGIALAIFFKKTRFGAAIRAAAENSDRASLLGINVKMLQVGVWVIAGWLAAVATVAPMAVVSDPAAGGDPSMLLLPFAAAVLARMHSMPVAFFAATGMVVLRGAIQYETSLAAILTLIQFGIIMVGLLVQRKRLETRVDGSTSWKAVKEIRPTPRELLALRPIRRTRRALIIVFGVVVLGLPWMVSLSTIDALSGVWVTAIIGASLVVLTGWTGQVSLGQIAIVAVGAFVGGNATTRLDIPFLLSLPLAGIAGAVFALLVGLPALRIRGLFLAIATLSISAVMPLLLFDPTGPFTKWTPASSVERPALFFLKFEDAKSMYYLLLVFFVLTIAGLQALRKSRTGRVMIGLRDNEAGVQSFGINVVRTRLAAFALSGFIAGFAGALKIALEHGMDVSTYGVDDSINIFVMVLIGGISTVVGAFLGAAYLVLGALLFPALQQQIQGALGLLVLLFIPGGFAQVIFGMRDAVLRVVAMRQNIVVPSLFADYSPEAWEKRLAPLAPSSQSSGLAALRHDQRYAMPSKVLGEAPA